MSLMFTLVWYMEYILMNANGWGGSVDQVIHHIMYMYLQESSLRRSSIARC